VIGIVFTTATGWKSEWLPFISAYLNGLTAWRFLCIVFIVITSISAISCWMDRQTEKREQWIKDIQGKFDEICKAFSAMQQDFVAMRRNDEVQLSAIVSDYRRMLWSDDQEWQRKVRLFITEEVKAQLGKHKSTESL